MLGGTTSLADSRRARRRWPNPLEALDEAVDLDLLQLRDDTGVRGVTFSHPLVQAAVYEQLGPAAARAAAFRGGRTRRRRGLGAAPSGHGGDPARSRARRGSRRLRATAGGGRRLGGRGLGAASRPVGSARTGGTGAAAAPRRRRHGRCGRPASRPRPSRGTRSPSPPDRCATPRSAIWPSFAGSPSRPSGCCARPGGAPTTRAMRRCARWWRSGGPCTPSGGCAADVVDWAQRRSSWHRPAIRCGSRHRRCSGWASAGRGGCRGPRSVRRDRWTASPTTETGPPLERVHMARGWLRLVADDVVGRTPAPGRDGSRRGAQRPSVRIAVWSYVWLARAGSRSAPGTRRRRTRSGRCRCWRSPGTGGCASWRGSRRCRCRRRGASGRPRRSTRGPRWRARATTS